MKLRQENKRGKGLRAKELLRHEKEEESGFDPETSIPPEVRKGYFQELDQLAQEKSWIEYIFLFNRLAELFPDQAAGVKKDIPPEELAAAWKNSLKEKPEGKEMHLDWKRSHTSEVKGAVVALSELKGYGLPTDGLLAEDEAEKYKRSLSNELRQGFAKLHDLLAGLRLGLLKPGTVFEPGDAEYAWMTNERRLDSKRPDLLPESVAIIKLLFPEKDITLDPESISAARQKALDELKGFGDFSSADLFSKLDLAASDISINERGELVKRRATKHRLGSKVELPTRPTV